MKNLLALLLLLIACRTYAQSLPLLHAFAHNDYWHKRPLFDALDNGYTNIEADVYARRGKLVVAHFPPFFKKKRTLEDLYLRPLYKALTEDTAGSSPLHGSHITLLIDIKSKATRTCKKLIPLLDKYQSILSSYQDGKLHDKGVTIVLSGHRPYGLIRKRVCNFLFFDENLKKIEKDTTFCSRSPIASCKYGTLLKWHGEGDIPQQDKDTLCRYVNRAHTLGQKVRLWASPENRRVWKELLACGVDLICTDKLLVLKSFLQSTNP